ncbi:MAG: sigma-54-dependent Fis family transcriptional regulator [Deltaproteobacteria bacterium]|nr:sigma-54-dependent Fis family transcriptional regulator [Deltaproteobacteria bacterium]
MGKNRVLIIDDEPSLLESLDMYLNERGYEVKCALDASDGLEKVDSFNPEAIVLDIRLPDRDGLEVLKELKRRGKESHTITITAFHDMETTIKAIKLGAHEYIPKPIDVEELEKAIEKVLKLSRFSRRRDVLTTDPSQEYEKGEIIGKSKEMKELFKTIGRLSENRITVLIEGETGTGKELIARAIHYHSPHRDQPFLAINCSAIVGTLLESELFGHEKGAFTGSTSTKRGKFELACDGTIFLDEVSEIPFELQAKLLRFLQEKEFERVGGEKTLKSNARIIAATNRDIWQMVKEGIFREDLYYRLSVATIKPPPLREHKSDIPLLIEYLLKKINRELCTNVKRVEERAVRRMMKYDWPGNVREMENVLTHAAIITQGEVILDDFLTPLLGKEEIKGGDGLPALALEEVEREHIIKVLNYTHWHYGKACRLLGISRPTLRQKLKKYGVSPPI